MLELLFRCLCLIDSFFPRFFTQFSPEFKAPPFRAKIESKNSPCQSEGRKAPTFKSGIAPSRRIFFTFRSCYKCRPRALTNPCKGLVKALRKIKEALQALRILLAHLWVWREWQYVQAAPEAGSVVGVARLLSRPPLVVAPRHAYCQAVKAIRAR